jgi:hypothetical protein
MQELQDRNEYLQGELAKKSAQIAALKGQRKRQPETDPLYPQAREVFEYWKAKLMPKARTLTGERATHTIARLRDGWEVADLKLAVDGCALSSWHMGVGKIDLEFICRNEENLLDFVGRADRAQAPDSVVAADLVSPEQVEAWRKALDKPKLLDRLKQLRGWKPEVVRRLGLGFDGKRIVIPGYDANGILTGLAKYAPNPATRNGDPKLIATGSRELFPPPERIKAKTVWLVEGENDAVAMSSIGQHAIGVPGINTWKDGWPGRFTGFETVRIVFDCDLHSREAAKQRYSTLRNFTHTQVIDLDSDREDGYDVTDLILEMGRAKALRRLQELVNLPQGPVLDEPKEKRERDPQVYEHRLDDLEARGFLVRRSGDDKANCQCPAHDDRTPSMVASRGDDGRMLLDCKVGCAVEDICGVMGWEMRDLFP